MRVLIAGCGYVGSALAARLAAEGAQVYGLARRPRGLSEGVVPVTADLTEPASLAALPGPFDAVVYAASADARQPEAYERAYVRGVATLLERLAAEPPRRFVFVSSTGVYAEASGAWVDETSPTEPVSFTGRALLAGEMLVASAPCPGTVLRFGGIYGPGRTGLLERVRSGKARWRPDHYTNRIHRDDCAGVLHHLLRLAPAEPLYLGVDDEPALERDVLAWLAARLGVPAPPAAEPGEGGRRASGSKRCRNARLRASGYRFGYPSFREGYAALTQG